MGARRDGNIRYISSATLIFSFLIALLLPNRASIQGFSIRAPSTSSNEKSALFSGHAQNKASPTSNSVIMTYLEINGWLLSMGGVTILVDPILEGSLNFGIPSLYEGKKRVLPMVGLADCLPEIDCLLITQGLDDHAHVQTLQKLRRIDPNLPIVAPPSAMSALAKAGFTNPEIINHSEEVVIRPRATTARKIAASKTKITTASNTKIHIRATKGALVGPPWQRRENGYVLSGYTTSCTESSRESQLLPSIYLEPHVEFNRRELAKLGMPVDICISPITGQSLPAFELVHGPRDTMRLLEILKPKYLVPMQNGDLDTEGPVSGLVSTVGSVDELQDLLEKSRLATQLVDVVPGKDIEVTM